MTEHSYTVYACPDCGEQVHAVPSARGHYHDKKFDFDNWVDAVPVEVYTRADVINCIRDEAAKLQDVGFSRRVGDVLAAAFSDHSEEPDQCEQCRHRNRKLERIEGEWICATCKGQLHGWPLPDDGFEEPVSGEGLGEMSDAISALSQRLKERAERHGERWDNPRLRTEVRASERGAQIACIAAVDELEALAATHPAEHVLSEEARDRLREIAESIDASPEGDVPTAREDAAFLRRLAAFPNQTQPDSQGSEEGKRHG